jgi:hypothetical protein
LQEAIRQSLKGDAKEKATPAPAPPPAPPADLLDFGGDDTPAPTPALPSVPVTSFSGIESVQSDPYYGGHPAQAHQSFTSLPAITSPGYGPPSTDFAAVAAPGALVVAAPSTGYGNYGMPHNNQQPYGNVGVTPSVTNPYANTNPYALAPSPNPPAAPYQYTAPYQHATPQGNLNESGSNPYGASTTTPNANPYAIPATAATHANPYATPNTFPGAANPYAAPTPSNPYLAPVPAANPYSNNAPVDSKNPWTPPAPITTQPNPYDSAMPAQLYDTFNGGSVPLAVTPHAQQTPSSLGFGSPAPDFSGFTPAPDEKTFGGIVQNSNPFGYLTMNGLASVDDDVPPPDPQQAHPQATSVVQSTFAKLANFDNFSISSNADAKHSNPFESPANASIGGNRSLADMAKNKVRIF